MSNKNPELNRLGRRDFLKLTGAALVGGVIEKNFGPKREQEGCSSEQQALPEALGKYNGHLDELQNLLGEGAWRSLETGREMTETADGQSFREINVPARLSYDEKAGVVSVSFPDSQGKTNIIDITRVSATFEEKNKEIFAFVDHENHRPIRKDNMETVEGILQYKTAELLYRTMEYLASFACEADTFLNINWRRTNLSDKLMGSDKENDGFKAESLESTGLTYNSCSAFLRVGEDDHPRFFQFNLTHDLY